MGKVSQRGFVSERVYRDGRGCVDLIDICVFVVYLILLMYFVHGYFIQIVGLFAL